MLLVPHLLVKLLCVLCFVLNSISIGLCLSALFLLTLAYLNLGSLLELDDNGDYQTANLTAATTDKPDRQPTLSLLPDSNPDQLNLIVYLLFYLAVAVLGLLGATTHYRPRRTVFLLCHVMLLLGVICYNLLAWFHFRTYSPLNSIEHDDGHLLIASLFDFLDFLVGLSLLIALLINRNSGHGHHHKQRNSISPISENGETYP